jgi:hypothetical protein
MFNEALYSLPSYFGEKKGPTKSHSVCNRFVLERNCSALRHPYVKPPSVSSNAETFAREPGSWWEGDPHEFKEINTYSWENLMDRSGYV